MADALLWALCAFLVWILLYTYFGYPIVIGLLARLFPRKTDGEDPSWTPKVSVLLPVHNAAGYLPQKLDCLLALDWPKDALEILVYSDGSTDDTTAIGDRYAERDPRIRMLRGGLRAGKPTALNEMLELANGEVLFMTDVRQPIDPGCLRALVRRLAPPSVGCVSGNLVLPATKGAGVYWRYENWLRNREATFRSMLGVAGAVYAIRKADLPKLPEDLILDDMWVAMRLRLQRRTVAYAVDAIATDEAFDDDKEFGRKVRTLAGNYQLLALLPGVLFPWSNPSWFEFVSHKLMRLVCPFALLGLFVVLPGAALLNEANPAIWQLLALAQLGFYALALVGDQVGKLGQLARTFVVLNAAAVVGLWRHLRQTQRITW